MPSEERLRRRIEVRVDVHVQEHVQKLRLLSTRPCPRRLGRHERADLREQHGWVMDVYALTPA